MHYFVLVFFGVFFNKMVIFLCHLAVCSVATRLLFCSGKGTLLPHALYRPICCHFPGGSKVKLYEKALGAVATLLAFKIMHRWLLGKVSREKHPSWVGVNSAIENFCQGLSARWLLGWLSHSSQQLALPHPSLNDVHRNIQFRHGTHSLCMQPVATYMR